MNGYTEEQQWTRNAEIKKTFEMAMTSDDFWTAQAGKHGLMATLCVNASGSTIQELVERGPDVFFVASGAARGQDEKTKSSIYMEVVRIVDATKTAQD